MQKTIELKATGEIITFNTSDTGQYIETIVTLPASGEGPPAHRHVLQSEVFEAIEGKLGLDCGDLKIVLEPGQTFTVPPNTPHRCYSIDGTAIRCKGTFTPALYIEYFLTEIFESCNRQNAKEPSLFDACYIFQQMKGEYYLEGVPKIIQQTVIPLLASIGKLLGQVNAKPKNEG